MPIGLESFPRDENAQIVGEWRLIHKSSDFNEAFNGVEFRNGVTTKPVSGRMLYRIIGALGDQLDAEPWEGSKEVLNEPGTLPAVILGQKAYPNPKEDKEDEDIPETDIQVKPIERHDDELDGMERDPLFSLATGLGLDPDGRWGAERLRKYIRDNIND